MQDNTGRHDSCPTSARGQQEVCRLPQPCQKARRRQKFAVTTTAKSAPPGGSQKCAGSYLNYAEKPEGAKSMQGATYAAGDMLGRSRVKENAVECARCEAVCLIEAARSEGDRPCVVAGREAPKVCRKSPRLCKRKPARRWLDERRYGSSRRRTPRGESRGDAAGAVGKRRREGSRKWTPQRRSQKCIIQAVTCRRCRHSRRGGHGGLSFVVARRVRTLVVPVDAIAGAKQHRRSLGTPDHSPALELGEALAGG